MAGLGRRSHYRKHLTDAVLHDLPEPDESLGRRIARVVGTRGGNMFDVVVASSTSPSSSKTQTKDDTTTATTTLVRTPQLAFLPTKFRKLVWIKRNDFVIVECGDEEQRSDTTHEDHHGKKADGGGSGFRYVICHILYKDQVKHIKSKGLWPADDSFFDDVLIEGQEQQLQSKALGKDENDEESDEEEYEQYEDEDGIVFDDPLLTDDSMVNTNRIAAMRVEDSSSDESDD